MKEGSAINTLVSQLEGYQVISLVGNIKNAGKTTVLNYLLSNYQDILVGVTSIGLDGEKIDQVTFLPKPRIYVYTGMIVVTSKACLDECEADYEIIKKTNIKTSLGEIYIIRITANGNCLVGGPSSIKSMQVIIEELKRLNCSKILIDGAFSRITLAQLADAIILSIGASYSQQLEKIATNAYNIVKLFQLPRFKSKHNLQEFNKIVLIDNNNELLFINKESTLDCGLDIIKQINENIKYMYIPRVVSQSFIKEFIANRHKLYCDLIINNPTHLLVDEVLLKQIFKLKQKVYVLKQINLVALTFNPFSPKGNIPFKSFREVLKERITIPIYNVLDKDN